MVDLEGERIADFDRAEFDVDFVEMLTRRGFGNSDHFGLAALIFNRSPGIAHLTAGLSA
jgi:hypothetical protein